MTEALSLSGDPSNLSLTETLDVLLERYLTLLHEHQDLHQQLSRNLSSGWLALAQANFQSPNRAHYGQDLYDDRMQATTIISIIPSFPSSTPKFTLVPPEPSLLDSTTTSSTDLPVLPDPIRQFGILVPPVLRRAQHNFTVAVDLVPQIASLAGEMQAMEIEIRRIRKKIMKATNKSSES